MKVADLSAARSRNTLTRHGSRLAAVDLPLHERLPGLRGGRALEPVQGFSFGYNEYTTGSASARRPARSATSIPGDQPIEGQVDQATGTITLSVPRSYLRGLGGATTGNLRPTLDKAAPGTRFYDATAYSLGNTSPDPTTQSFLYPIDNPPAMDFLLPGIPASPPTAGATGPCSNQIEGTKKKDKLKGTDGRTGSAATRAPTRSVPAVARTASADRAARTAPTVTPARTR